MKFYRKLMIAFIICCAPYFFAIGMDHKKVFKSVLEYQSNYRRLINESLPLEQIEALERELKDISIEALKKMDSLLGKYTALLHLQEGHPVLQMQLKIMLQEKKDDQEGGK